MNSFSCWMVAVASILITTRCFAADATTVVLSVVEGYIRAELSHDADAMISYWPEDYVKLIGGSEGEMVDQMRGVFRADDHGRRLWMRVDVGQPEFLQGTRNRVAVVPALGTVEGFPNAQTNDYTYLLVSSDSGASWHVLDQSCSNNEWVQRATEGSDWLKRAQLQRMQPRESVLQVETTRD